MTDENTGARMTISEEKKKLRDLIIDDIQDRKPWFETCSTVRAKRMSEKKAVKKYPYPGAPNFVVPIIDDIVRRKVSEELSMMLNAQKICHFMPMTVDAFNISDIIEDAFNWLLRFNLKARSKLESIIDCKNEIGISVAKLVDNFNVIPNQNCPDFVWVDPFDFVIPWDSKTIEDADRMVHVIRLTERELRERGSQKAWKNIDELISKAKEGGTSDSEYEEYKNRYGSRTDMKGIATSSSDKSYYTLWEIYTYRKEGGGIFDKNPDSDDKTYLGSSRWVYVMSPEFPEIDIMDYQYDWDKWPFVQFKYECRTDKFYESRGCGQLCLDEQIYATQCKNMKSVFLEYAGKPLFTGKVQNSQNISFTPGSILPEGITPVNLPNVPTAFDYDINSSYMMSEKRCGTAMQSLTGGRAGIQGGKKTATEVEAEMNISGVTNTDSVERNNEPLQELFSKIWDRLSKRMIIFPFMSDDKPEEPIKLLTAYSAKWALMPSGNTSTANPLLMKKQVEAIAPMLLQSPFGNQYEIYKMLVSIINPKLVPKLLIDPSAVGPQGQAPIVQQVQSLAQSSQQQMQMIQQIGMAMQKLQPDLIRMQDEIRGNNAQRRLEGQP